MFKIISLGDTPEQIKYKIKKSREFYYTNLENCKN